MTAVNFKVCLICRGYLGVNGMIDLGIGQAVIVVVKPYNDRTSHSIIMSRVRSTGAGFEPTL